MLSFAQFSVLLLFYPVLITGLVVWLVQREIFEARDQVARDPTLWPSQRLAETSHFFGLPPRRVIWLGLFHGYLTIASLLTLLPIPPNLGKQCELPNYRWHVELNPLLAFDRGWSYFVRHGNDWTVWGIVSDAGIQQLYLNILLTMPLGLFLKGLFHVSYKHSMMFGFAIILLWEICQLSGVFGLAPCPWRTFSTNDLLMNGFGLLLGWTFAAAFSSKHVHNL